MTVRASLSSTVISLLSTVGSSASMVSKTVDSAASSVDMLDRFVQRAKDKQLTAHTIEDANWRTNLILQSAKDQEKLESQLAKEYSSDQNRANRFNSIVQNLEALFVPKEA